MDRCGSIRHHLILYTHTTIKLINTFSPYTPYGDLDMKRVHIILSDEVYEGIWNIVKKRYVSPIRKFQLVVNEALMEFIEKHKDEVQA